MGRKKREQSIELLRIVLMTLIVFGHIIGHGTTALGQSFTPYTLMVFYIIFHVNAFVFISGYYGIRLKWSKFAILIAKMVIYSIVVIGIVSLATSDFDLSVSSFSHNMYPISNCDWWFMSEYLFLMLFAPIINNGTERLNRSQATVLLIVLYVFMFRSTFPVLIYMYVLGRYFRKYPCTFIEKNAGKIFLITMIAFYAIDKALDMLGVSHSSMFLYTSPFAVIPAVAIFYVFKKMHLQWSGIGVLASGALAAYLVTDHELLRPVFTSRMMQLANSNIACVFLLAFITVTICSFVDVILTNIIKKLVTSKSIEKKVTDEQSDNTWEDGE